MSSLEFDGGAWSHNLEILTRAKAKNQKLDPLSPLGPPRLLFFKWYWENLRIIRRVREPDLEDASLESVMKLSTNLDWGKPPCCLSVYEQNTSLPTPVTQPGPWLLSLWSLLLLLLTWIFVASFFLGSLAADWSIGFFFWLCANSTFKSG